MYPLPHILQQTLLMNGIYHSIATYPRRLLYSQYIAYQLGVVLVVVAGRLQSQKS